MQQPDQTTNPFGTSSTPPIEFFRVGFGKRFLAALMDVLITLTVSLAVALIVMQSSFTLPGFITNEVESITQLYSLIGISSSITSLLTTLIGSFMLGITVVGALYPLIEGLTGASPGKRVLRITVANANGSIGNLSLFLKRWAIKNIGGLLQLVGLLTALGVIDIISNVMGFIIFVGAFAMFSNARMALHDIIAQSAVFHIDDVQQ